MLPTQRELRDWWLRFAMHERIFVEVVEGIKISPRSLAMLKRCYALQLEREYENGKSKA